MQEKNKSGGKRPKTFSSILTNPYRKGNLGKVTDSYGKEEEKKESRRKLKRKNKRRKCDKEREDVEENEEKKEEMGCEAIRKQKLNRGGGKVKETRTGRRRK